MHKNFTDIQSQIQYVIDLIAQKNISEANKKLLLIHETLDDLIDFSQQGDDLIELARFQVLLNHLQHKIEVLKVELN